MVLSEMTQKRFDSVIKIPIKEIVLNAESKYGADYKFLRLDIRKYFIDALNYGCILPKDLKNTVESFAKKIKQIRFCSEASVFFDTNDGYCVGDNTIYIGVEHSEQDYDFMQKILGGDNECLDFSFDFKESENYDETLEIYKGLTSALLFSKNIYHTGFAIAMCEIIANKLLCKKLDRKCRYEFTGDKTICFNCEYDNNSLIVCLLKELFEANGIDEDNIIRDLFLLGFDRVILKYFSSDENRRALDIIDKLQKTSVRRKKYLSSSSYDEKIIFEMLTLLDSIKNKNDIFSQNHNIFVKNSIKTIDI